MNEMVNYIFGTLANTDARLKNVYKNLRLQRAFNTRVVLFAVGMTANMIFTNRILKSYNEEIKKLNDEIEKLKETTEGDKESTESVS